MEFKSKAHKEIYERIGEWMKELFGMFFDPIPGAPVYIFRHGDTLVQITVGSWGQDDASITARSYVVHDVEITPELTHYLLRENATFRFGAFGLDDDDDVFFEHTIVGSTCDKGELKASILSVASTCSRYAEKLIPEHGGVKTVDKLRESAEKAGVLARR
jgi:hypothetical protein